MKIAAAVVTLLALSTVLACSAAPSRTDDDAAASAASKDDSKTSKSKSAPTSGITHEDDTTAGDDPASSHPAPAKKDDGGDLTTCQKCLAKDPQWKAAIACQSTCDIADEACSNKCLTDQGCAASEGPDRCFDYMEASCAAECDLASATGSPTSAECRVCVEPNAQADELQSCIATAKTEAAVKACDALPCNGACADRIRSCSDACGLGR